MTMEVTCIILVLSLLLYCFQLFDIKMDIAFVDVIYSTKRALNVVS